jgi:hypothetical protein
MLRKTARMLLIGPVGVMDPLCGPGFLETPLGMLWTATLISPANEQKNHCNRKRGRTPFGMDPEHPALFRRIRITPRPRCQFAAVQNEAT